MRGTNIGCWDEYSYSVRVLGGTHTTAGQHCPFHMAQTNPCNAPMLARTPTSILLVLTFLPFASSEFIVSQMSFLLKARKDKDKAKEIPSWKLAMLEAEGGGGGGSSSGAGASDSGGIKRPRPEDAANDERAGKQSSSSATDGPLKRPPAPPAPDLPPGNDDNDDDDDDEGFDPANYQLGDGSDDDDGAAADAAAWNQPEPSVEEKLLMRERRDGNKGVPRGKTFYVEDNEASLATSLGKERAEARRQTMKAMKRGEFMHDPRATTK